MYEAPTVMQLCCPVRFAVLYGWLSPHVKVYTACIMCCLSPHVLYMAYIDALCRLWSTKQEQEKVLDEEATKRKQDAADAKVRRITHHQSLLQITFIGQS